MAQYLDGTAASVIWREGVSTAYVIVHGEVVRVLKFDWRWLREPAGRLARSRRRSLGRDRRWKGQDERVTARGAVTMDLQGQPNPR